MIRNWLIKKLNLATKEELESLIRQQNAINLSHLRNFNQAMGNIEFHTYVLNKTYTSEQLLQMAQEFEGRMNGPVGKVVH